MNIIKTEPTKEKFSLVALFKHIFSDHIFESAATLSYYFLFSIFPFAIFVSAAFSTLNISPASMIDLSGIIPQEILSIMTSYLEEISLGNTLSLILIGVILTLYSMGKAIQTMKRKFRKAYGLAPKSGGIKDWIVSFIFVLLVLFSFYASLILVVTANFILSGLTSIFPELAELLPSLHILRLFAIAVYLFFMLFGMYFLLPGIRQRKRDVLPGTLFAMLAWVLTSWLFSFYFGKSAVIGTLYGSLGAIVAILTWLFAINLILLTGAYINSYLYLKRNERTT